MSISIYIILCILCDVLWLKTNENKVNGSPTSCPGTAVERKDSKYLWKMDDSGPSICKHAG